MAEFVTKKENIRRLVILIVCIVVNVAALTAGIWAMKGADEVEKSPEKPETIVKVREQISAQREINRELMSNYLAYARDIGWRFEATGTVDRFTTSPLQHESLKNYLNGWVLELKKLGVTKYKAWGDPGAGEPLLLTRLFDELIAKENEYRARIEEIKGQIQKEKESEKQVADATQAVDIRLMSEVAGNVDPTASATGLIGDFIRLNKEVNVLQKTHTEEMVQLEKDTIDAQVKATETKNESLRKSAAAEAVKMDFKKRIYTIQHHREEARELRNPDGEVLSINEDLQTATISLLRRDRLFKGTRFHVYSLEKGGQKLDKGQIEVIDVRERLSSVCAILSTVDVDWPLKVGDKIYNEMYEGGRSRHIAFAGRFTGKLSNEEAENLVRKSGDTYQDKVDEKTSYVVVADGYEEHPNYKEALEYGIKILREKILYDYLGVKQ